MSARPPGNISKEKGEIEPSPSNDLSPIRTSKRLRIALCFRGAMPRKQRDKFNGRIDKSGTELIEIDNCIKSIYENLACALMPKHKVDIYVHSWDIEAEQSIAKTFKINKSEINSQKDFKPQIDRLSLVARLNRSDRVHSTKNLLFDATRLFYVHNSSGKNTTGRTWGMISQSFTIGKSLSLAIGTKEKYDAIISLRPDILLKHKFSSEELDAIIGRLNESFFTEEISEPPPYVEEHLAHGDCLIIMNEALARELVEMPYFCLSGCEMRPHSIITTHSRTKSYKACRIKGLIQNKTLLMARKAYYSTENDTQRGPKRTNGWKRRIVMALNINLLALKALGFTYNRNGILDI